LRENEIEVVKGLRKRGVSYRKIAEATGHSIETVRKYCKDVEKGDALAVMDKKGMITMPTNPLDALTDINDLVNVNVSAGVVAGAGIASIHRGFKDESLDDVTRIGNVMKGMASLGGLVFSTYRTVQELSKQTKEQEPKTVPSPSYEELVEKVKRLEKDKDIIEKKNKEEVNG